MKVLGLIFASIFVLYGCSDNEQHSGRLRYNDEGKQAAQAQESAPEATSEPEPTEAPTPIPKDSNNDIVHTTSGHFTITNGEIIIENDIIKFKSIEVAEGEDHKDIAWVMPGGTVLILDLHRHKVKKMQ